MKYIWAENILYLSPTGANKSTLPYFDEKDCYPLLPVQCGFFDCLSTASKRGD